ncbi:MAG: hypothetical protein EBR82_44395 [Caulobacteraceae bacterium]|nr:hypothetical protein [Caulobacteraceae bacterium]
MIAKLANKLSVNLHKMNMLNMRQIKQHNYYEKQKLQQKQLKNKHYLTDLALLLTKQNCYLANEALVI